ncbi:MAG TPA: hypothetical protein VHV28_15830 [Solirubrobacteraceae bacterium]|jgi:hypothetical protein|nr:hypothetical protein [Solirubrobacteraceae bacterium]
MPEKSILDARLAEIDQRLRTIQSGLEPAATAARAERAAQAPPKAGAPVVLHEAHAPVTPPPEPHAPVVPPEAAPVPKRLTADTRALDEALARLTALVDAHERLLASAQELADRRRAGDAGAVVSISAGPFDGTEALRRFERSLLALPEVRSAVVREYEGADRAVVDVLLSEPTP